MSITFIMMVVCGIALIGVLLAVLVVWMQNRSIGPDEAQAVDLPPRAAPNINREAASPLLLGQIRSLLEAGNKIEAIRVYREATQSSLKTAKEAVEAFERGELLQIPARPSPEPPAGVASDPADLQEKIESLVRKGNKLQAIAIYRREMGVDLKAAKDAIDALESGMPWALLAPVGHHPQVENNVDDQVRELLRRGQKIEAIKLVRETTDLGLAEAKMLVESYEVDL